VSRRPIASNALPSVADPSPPARFVDRGDRGFALIATIWGLGLITLLGLALIVGARYRARTSLEYTSIATTELAAESAVNLAIAQLLTVSSEPRFGFPLSCVMPGGERATISVEEESGKIDLNTATSTALTRFFTALTRDQSAGIRIASRIAEIRERPQRQSKERNDPPPGPPPPAFATIMQLDEVGGLPPHLVRTGLHFVTVHSGRPEPDLDAATPDMLGLLGVAPKKQSSSRKIATDGNVTIRADVRGPAGSRFIREALVSLSAENGRLFAIREWRHGDIGLATNSSLDLPRNVQRCIELAQVPAG